MVGEFRGLPFHLTLLPKGLARDYVRNFRLEEDKTIDRNFNLLPITAWFLISSEQNMGIFVAFLRLPIYLTTDVFKQKQMGFNLAKRFKEI